MPVGAVIGAGVLTAGATVATGAMASHAQTSAANNAADISLATAQENNALARDMYNANASRLDPYSAMGLAAGDEYMGLLLGDAPAADSHAGSGWAPVAGTPTPTTGGTGTGTTPTPAPATYSGPSLTQILAMKDDGIPGNYEAAMNAYNSWYASHPSTGSGSALAPFGAAAPQPAPSALSPVVAQQAQQAIAAGADPAAVRARAAQYGVPL